MKWEVIRYHLLIIFYCLSTLLPLTYSTFWVLSSTNPVSSAVAGGVKQTASAAKWGVQTVLARLAADAHSSVSKNHVVLEDHVFNSSALRRDRWAHRCGTQPVVLKHALKNHPVLSCRLSSSLHTIFTPKNATVLLVHCIYKQSVKFSAMGWIWRIVRKLRTS